MYGDVVGDDNIDDDDDDDVLCSEGAAETRKDESGVSCRGDHGARSS